MTTPRVTEMPLRLEPVQPDSFIGVESRSSAVPPRLTEREERVRRVELVRRVMRVRASKGAAQRHFVTVRRHD